MNPVYYENCFPEQLAKDLESYLRSAPWYWGFYSHKSMMQKSSPHWSIIFAGPKNKSQEFYDCEKELDGVIKSLWDYIKPQFLENDMLVRCYANGVTPGMDQKLHTDDLYPGSKTCIVYINEQWTADWGGETIVWDKDKRLITNSYLPKFRSTLIIDGSCWHGVRPASTNYCSDLRMTVMFKTRPSDWNS